MEHSSDIKILIVDDREDNLLSIESILEKDQYTIVKANSGRAALKILLHQHDFSLILMDVQMPDMNGLETATLIYQRNKLKDIPIIFITAHNYDDELVFKGYKMGGVDYIYKPINPELLKVKVSVFVELYRKNLQLINHEKKLISANTLLQKEIEDRKVSEQKIILLNQQLTEKNEHLRSVNEELDRFAYIASHDLQEPLRKIIIFSDKILTENTGQDKYLQKIVHSSRRMQQLINDLLSFSRQDISTSDFKLTDLNQIVKEALLELEIEIDRTSAQIKMAIMPSLRVVPSLIRQLFYNLISNAIKFRRKNTVPVITIDVKRSIPEQYDNPKNITTENFYFIITITDNGIGFDQSHAEDIFAIFKRLNSDKDYEGTGVGLSICKKIIEKHNGFIKAKGQLDHGSTFIIGIPDYQHTGI